MFWPHGQSKSPRNLAFRMPQDAKNLENCSVLSARAMKISEEFTVPEHKDAVNLENCSVLTVRAMKILEDFGVPAPPERCSLEDFNVLDASGTLRDAPELVQKVVL